MATKIRQKPKVTKKSPAKAKSIGGGPKKVQHLSSHTNPTTPKSKGAKTSVSASTNKMPTIVEYPGERKGRSFGKEVKVVGQRG